MIRAGIIAPGDVDERSIEDVRPGDLTGYVQCHFFAGTGVWSYALRCAGWSDDRPVWTGSCPCQPFSAAGKGAGFADERHLWPAFFHLVRVCRPRTVFGEQVSSNDGLAWLNHVRTDLEGEGHAVGVTDLCAAGFGAPHIRQRLYFVADAPDADRWTGERGAEAGTRSDGEWRRGSTGGGPVVVLGNPSLRGRGKFGDETFPGCGGHPDGAEQIGVALGDALLPRLEGHAGDGRNGDEPGRDEAYPARPASSAGGTGRLADSEHDVRWADQPGRKEEERVTDGRPGPVNGFWRDAAWIPCRDGKWRPVEPGTFPLVAGPSKGMVRGGDPGAPIDANATAEARVMRLRGYGNSI
ncbi:MAG: DNA cytosine methyltransferase, partial [Deltaproteobacteria bacterium]|nr:DNA cytosine methyltransferase [Deltaproteobacteria bacterium]